ncbi:Allantoin permease [Metarhizium anisopliae]
MLATGALLLSSLAGSYYHSASSWLSTISPTTNRRFWLTKYIAVNFPVFSRAVWGQCFYLILLSWDPKYEQRIPNTMPADIGATSAQFISYVVLCILSLPFIWIPPHRLQKFFYFASGVTIIFFLTLLIWAVVTMGSGGFGTTLSPESATLPTGGPKSIGWLITLGIISTMGSIAAGILNQNDLARFAKQPGSAIWGQAVAFPLYSIFSSVLGILVVAATQKRFQGEAIWNPPTLFVRLLEMDDSAGTRTAIFFAGLALCASQLGINITSNALAGGIDLASVFPRYINIRRGAYITAILSPVVNPWRLVNTATTFLSVLSGYSIFLAPMSGLMTASYLVVNKQKLKIDDLYRGNSESIYWYTWGINFRAPVAWIVGVAPCLPGFVAAVDTSVSVTDGAAEMYYINYLYGFLSSATLYILLHWIFPAPAVEAFVREAPSSREIQRYYCNRWDIPLAETLQTLKEDFKGT